ncbi:hypothetical protein [Bdellovibrio sp. HCB2-146]|uniref:hypothetical protein n=1 Tax=Bdellovibrio sp. HCB2-146 TaxID=3394362 RepID=UPI0039BD6177
MIQALRLALALFVFTPFLAKALPPVSERPDLNEFYSSAFQLPDTRICAVFENLENFQSTLPQAKMYFVCLKDRRFTKARQLQPGISEQFNYFANARPVTINGKIWIYFTAVDTQKNESKWGRFAFDENDPETPVEWLNAQESLVGQIRPWIFPSLTSSGDILLAYEKRNSTTGLMDLFFARSAKGRDFSVGLPIASGAQMVRFAEFEKGPWAFSYQVGSGKQMNAFVKFSADQGQSFSTPIQISQYKNIHDTFLLKRHDGELDVYYLVWMEGSGYSLFRRQLKRDGGLGPEQQLTSTAVAVEKPHCLRLASGKIFVTLSKLNAPTSSTVASDIVFMTLMDDAE